MIGVRIDVGRVAPDVDIGAHAAVCAHDLLYVSLFKHSFTTVSLTDSTYERQGSRHLVDELKLSTLSMRSSSWRMCATSSVNKEIFQIGSTHKRTFDCCVQ